jgi:hypothetical protein
MKYLNSVEWNLYYALHNEMQELQLKEQTKEIVIVRKWIQSRLDELQRRMK